MRSLTGALRQCPRRRWITAALGAPVVAALLLATGRGGAWWGWPVAVLIAGLAALVMASYLPAPGSGRLLAVGCSPCAAVAAGGVAVAILARVGAPDGASTAARVASGLPGEGPDGRT